MRLFILSAFITSIFATILPAQDLRVSTVTRPPFSMQEGGEDTGFSIDLWRALMMDMRRNTEIIRADEFSGMLDLVAEGKTNAAIANISITAKREGRFDFSQPIFESGLQIMVPAKASSGFSIWSALLSKDLLLAIALSFAVLLAGGMLMWRFEKGKEEYFNLPARKALFPAFWWALNLVVNGGFEERVPRSGFGRVFGVLLVISSLFIVSLVVAKVTAALTIAELQGSVNSVNDLREKTVGTIGGSTASNYLETHNLRHKNYENLDRLLAAFEADKLDAVVFDAPVLAYYANNQGADKARMVGSVFMRENYGIILPPNSPLAEPLNQSLLRLKEDGTYEKLYRKWFGYSNN